MSEVKRLLEGLLWDIYGKLQQGVHTRRRVRRKQKQMGSDILELISDPHVLRKQSISNLIDISAMLKVEIHLMGYVLERVLITRDRSRRHQEILCEFVNAILLVFNEESNQEMRFSLSSPTTGATSASSSSSSVKTVSEQLPATSVADINNPPADGSSDFDQWLHAMKMVASLPGGMPPEFRRKLWLALAEKYLKSKNVDWMKEEEKCFCEKWREDDEELGIQIVKDLHRTGSSLCTGPAGTINQAKLKRILLGYARYNPEVGYCQGFNMLGALILQVMDKEESESMKVMIYLVEGLLPGGYFSGSLGGLQADMGVFRELMTSKMPHLAKHLQKLQGPLENAYEPPLTNVFTMQWFLTMFCTCLPMTCVLRVWDLVLIEGSDVLLRTALVLWSLLEERILSARTADDFYCKMGSFSSELLNGHLIDSNGLIERVVQLGPIADIQKLRDKHLYNVTPLRDKKGLQLYYSDDEADSDDDSKLAVATAFGLRIGRRGSVPPGKSSDNKDRLALDISLLKKQYDRLRERQRQAHIILTTAVARQSAGQNLQSSLPMNQLLMGRSAIVTNKGKRIGPPPGAIPPARKPSLPTIIQQKEISNVPMRKSISGASSVSSLPLDRQSRSGETLHWRDMDISKRRRDSLRWKDIRAESTNISESNRGLQEGNESAGSSRSNSPEPKSAKIRSSRRSESSSYSDESNDNLSSTDTSLCDDETPKNLETTNTSSLENSPVKKSKSNRKQVEKKHGDGQKSESNSGKKRTKSSSSATKIPFVQLMTTNSPVHTIDEKSKNGEKISLPSKVLDLDEGKEEEDSTTECDRLTYDFDGDIKSTASPTTETSVTSPLHVQTDLLNLPDTSIPASVVITSTSQLSPLPDITTYLSTSNISPLPTPISYFDYTNLVSSAGGDSEGSADETRKFDVNDEGVINEYFERVNAVERPKKLDLLYSLSDEDGIRNAFKDDPSPVYLSRKQSGENGGKEKEVETLRVQAKRESEESLSGLKKSPPQETENLLQSKTKGRSSSLDLNKKIVESRISRVRHSIATGVLEMDIQAFIAEEQSNMKVSKEVPYTSLEAEEVFEEKNLKKEDNTIEKKTPLFAETTLEMVSRRKRQSESTIVMARRPEVLRERPSSIASTADLERRFRALEKQISFSNSKTSSRQSSVEDIRKQKISKYETENAKKALNGVEETEQPNKSGRTDTEIHSEDEKFQEEKNVSPTKSSKYSCHDNDDAALVKTISTKRSRSYSSNSDQLPKMNGKKIVMRKCSDPIPSTKDLEERYAALERCLSSGSKTKTINSSNHNVLNKEIQDVQNSHERSVDENNETTPPRRTSRIPSTAELEDRFKVLERQFSSTTLKDNEQNICKTDGETKQKSKQENQKDDEQISKHSEADKTNVEATSPMGDVEKQCVKTVRKKSISENDILEADVLSVNEKLVKKHPNHLRENNGTTSEANNLTRETLLDHNQNTPSEEETKSSTEVSADTSNDDKQSLGGKVGSEKGKIDSAQEEKDVKKVPIAVDAKGTEKSEKSNYEEIIKQSSSEELKHDKKQNQVKEESKVSSSKKETTVESEDSENKTDRKKSEIIASDLKDSKEHSEQLETSNLEEELIKGEALEEATQKGLGEDCQKKDSKERSKKLETSNPEEDLIKGEALKETSKKGLGEDCQEEDSTSEVENEKKTNLHDSATILKPNKIASDAEESIGQNISEESSKEHIPKEEISMTKTKLSSKSPNVQEKVNETEVEKTSAREKTKVKAAEGDSENATSTTSSGSDEKQKETKTKESVKSPVGNINEKKEIKISNENSNKDQSKSQSPTKDTKKEIDETKEKCEKSDEKEEDSKVIPTEPVKGEKLQKSDNINEKKEEGKLETKEISSALRTECDEEKGDNETHLRTKNEKQAKENKQTHKEKDNMNEAVSEKEQSSSEQTLTSNENRKYSLKEPSIMQQETKKEDQASIYSKTVSKDIDSNKKDVSEKAKTKISEQEKQQEIDNRKKSQTEQKSDEASSSQENSTKEERTQPKVLKKQPKVSADDADTKKEVQTSGEISNDAPENKDDDDDDDKKLASEKLSKDISTEPQDTQEGKAEVLEIDQPRKLKRSSTEEIETRYQALAKHLNEAQSQNNAQITNTEDIENDKKNETKKPFDSEKKQSPEEEKSKETNERNEKQDLSKEETDTTDVPIEKEENQKSNEEKLEESKCQDTVESESLEKKKIQGTSRKKEISAVEDIIAKLEEKYEPDHVIVKKEDDIIAKLKEKYEFSKYFDGEENGYKCTRPGDGRSVELPSTETMGNRLESLERLLDLIDAQEEMRRSMETRTRYGSDKIVDLNKRPLTNPNLPSTKELEDRFNEIEKQLDYIFKQSTTTDQKKSPRRGHSYKLPTTEDLENRFTALEKQRHTKNLNLNIRRRTTSPVKIVEHKASIDENSPVDEQETISSGMLLSPSSSARRKGNSTKIEAISPSKRYIPSTKALELRFEALEKSKFPLSGSKSLTEKSILEPVESPLSGREERWLSVESLETRYNASEPKYLLTDQKEKRIQNEKNKTLRLREELDENQQLCDGIALEEESSPPEVKQGIAPKPVHHLETLVLSPPQKLVPSTEDLEDRFNVLNKSQKNESPPKRKPSAQRLVKKSQPKSNQVKQEKLKKESEIIKKPPIHPLEALLTTSPEKEIPSFDELEDRMRALDILDEDDEFLTYSEHEHDVYESTPRYTPSPHRTPSPYALHSYRESSSTSMPAVKSTRDRAFLIRKKSISMDDCKPTAIKQSTTPIEDNLIRPTSCPEARDIPLDQCGVSQSTKEQQSDRVLRVIEENSKILHRILKKTLADSISPKGDAAAAPGLLADVSRDSAVREAPHKVKKMSDTLETKDGFPDFAKPKDEDAYMGRTARITRTGTHTGLPLRTDDNISERLTSIKNTIKSIDSLCEEKGYRKDKCQRYIDSLFTAAPRTISATISDTNVGTNNTDAESQPPSINITDLSSSSSHFNSKCSVSGSDSIMRHTSDISMTRSLDSSTAVFRESMTMASPTHRSSNRDLRREASPRRRQRDEEREEYESRVRRDKMMPNIKVEQPFSYSLTDICNRVDSELGGRRDTSRSGSRSGSDSRSPYRRTTFDLDRPISPYRQPSSAYFSKEPPRYSIAPTSYVPTKLEIRHTTVTSTFYDRYLTQKQIERDFPRATGKSPVVSPSSLTTRSYLDISTTAGSISKSAENSPSRTLFGDTGVGGGAATTPTGDINHRKLFKLQAENDLQIRSCDNILMQLRSTSGAGPTANSIPETRPTRDIGPPMGSPKFTTPVKPLECPDIYLGIYKTQLDSTNENRS